MNTIVKQIEECLTTEENVIYYFRIQNYHRGLREYQLFSSAFQQLIHLLVNSQQLLDGYDVDFNIVYTVAAYHDLGHFIDRKRHEIISAEMFMKDENIKRWFADEQRMVIKEAIEDHRASCNHVPRTIYGKIVSTADRTIVDMDNTIKRSYTYGKKNYIGLSEEEQFDKVYEHLVEKYGESGYAKVYLEDKEFDEAVGKLRQALENREEFIERVKRVVSDL